MAHDSEYFVSHSSLVSFVPCVIKNPVIASFNSGRKRLSGGCDSRGFVPRTVDEHLLGGLERIVDIPLVDGDQVVWQECIYKLSLFLFLFDKEMR